MKNSVAGNRVYLSRVEISNFRPFGDNFKLDLPGPGVTLLVGPNGLGKTSWFDAIECGLTGNVRRWQMMPGGEVPPADRLRIGSSVNEWRIQLTFGERDAVFLRTASQDQTFPTGTPLSAITSYLATDASAWDLTEDKFSAFLFATHILPQSSRARRLSLDPEKRWTDWIQHAAGLERIDRFMRNLSPGTISELTKIVNERQGLYREAASRFEAWQNLLQQRDEEQHAVAGLAGAASPSIVSKSLASLRPEGRAVLLVEDTLAGAALVFERIGVEREALEQFRSQTTKRRFEIESLRGLVERWQVLLAQRTSLTDDLAEARRLAESARADVAKAKEAEDLSRRSFSLACRQIDACRELEDHWRRLGAARQDLARASQAAAESSAQFHASEQASILKQDTLAKQKSLRAARVQWETDLANARRDESRTRELIRRLNYVAEVVKESATLRNRAQEAGTKVAEARLLLASCEDKLRGSASRFATISQQLSHVRASAEAIRAAVAAIASILTEDVTSCPVCATAHAHGQLVEIARRKAEEASPDLARAEQEVSVGRTELEALRAERETATNIVKELESDAEAIRRRREALDSDIRSEMDEPEFHGRDPNELLSAFSRRTAELANLISELEKSDFSRSDSSALSDAIGHLEQEVNRASDLRYAARAEVEKHQRATAEIEDRINVVLAALQRLDGNFSETEDWVGHLQMRYSSAEAEVERQRLSVLEAEENTRVVEQNLRDATSRAELDSVRLHDVDKEKSSLLEQWRSNSLLGEPEGAVLADAIAHEDSNIATQQQQATELGRLASALDAWRKAVTLQSLRREIADKCGGFDREAEIRYSDQLAQERQDAGKRQARVELVRACAKDLSEKATQRSRDLKKAFIEGTGPAFERLLPLLVEDQRYRRLALSTEIDPKKKTSVKIPISSSNGDAPREAEHLMSEGQSAGLSCVLLLSLATTFRWSRWPALLLDDPAQHNDLVHTTNLIEVLRNLVMLHGYQVVLSTHDSTLADFFRRKLRNGGVNTVVCRFVDVGAGGVEARVSS